jgi:hypothetical protein
MEIKERIQQAVLDMMKKVKFDEVKHVYTTLDDTWLQGVSTVSSIIPKDWLAAWGAKEAVKFLGYSDYEGDTALAEEMLERIAALQAKKDAGAFIALLKEAKGASARKSKDALVDGTAGHAWLESPLPPLPDGNLKRPIMQFIDWAVNEVDYWIVSEARVAHPEKGYAGTLDAIAMMKAGKLAIVDFKFASHMSEDYYLQTAGYQATFEPYDIPFDERIIVRLPKTLESEEYDKTTRTYKKVENRLEAKSVPTAYENDRDVFYAMLPVKQWINQFINKN